MPDGDGEPLTFLTHSFTSCLSGAPDPRGRWVLRGAQALAEPSCWEEGRVGSQGNAVRRKYSMLPPEKQTGKSRSVKRQGVGEGGREGGGEGGEGSSGCGLAEHTC